MLLSSSSSHEHVVALTVAYTNGKSNSLLYKRISYYIGYTVYDVYTYIVIILRWIRECTAIAYPGRRLTQCHNNNNIIMSLFNTLNTRGRLPPQDRFRFSSHRRNAKSVLIYYFANAQFAEVERLMRSARQ